MKADSFFALDFDSILSLTVHILMNVYVYED